LTPPQAKSPATTPLFPVLIGSPAETLAPAVLLADTALLTKIDGAANAFNWNTNNAKIPLAPESFSIFLRIKCTFHLIRMNILERVLTLAKVSENAKQWITALAGIGGVIMAVGGVKDFLVKNGLTSFEDVHRIVFVTDRHTEIQPILKKVATELKADRAFIFLYKQNESGQWFTEFKHNYQWQIKGQTYIKDALYPLVKGGDTERFETMNVSVCKESITHKMGKTDPLAIAMKKSGVEAQVVCQVSAKVLGQERIGGIAVEFNALKDKDGKALYNKTETEAALIEASIDVEKAFR